MLVDVKVLRKTPARSACPTARRPAVAGPGGAEEGQPPLRSRRWSQALAAHPWELLGPAAGMTGWQIAGFLLCVAIATWAQSITGFALALILLG